jgi:hypothetical protein
MNTAKHGSAPIMRATGRGLVGAMAMSGVRAITSNLELMEETPPRKIIEHHGPRLLRRLPEKYLQAATEAVHWMYGSGGGLVFGLLPGSVRQHPMTGPVYGVGVWMAFEVGIAPALGVRHKQRRVLGRTMLFLDHLLYGVVVAGRLAPEPEITDGDGERQTI